MSQEGEPIVFRRRKPKQSILPTNGSLRHLFDHIRMLDADGYPPAYLDYGTFKMTFSSPEKLSDNSLQATVKLQRQSNLTGAQSEKESLHLRPMQLEDTREVYDWRYSQGAANYYLSNTIPEFMEHAVWIERRLKSDPNSLLIGEIEGNPVSHLRIDASGATVEISIYVNSAFRGFGFGKASLLALKTELQNRKIETAHATVSLKNKASIQLFESCGYKQDGEYEDFAKLTLELNPIEP